MDPARSTWLFRVARVLFAADLGAFRVFLRGLHNPAAASTESIAKLPEAVAVATATAAPGPAVGAHQAWQQASWARAVPFAAAGLLSVALTAVQAHCEGSHDGADLEQVKAAVMQIWEQLDQELMRVEASLPSRKALDRLPQPSVTRQGEEIVVEFWVPQALDVAGALHELRRQLRTPSFRGLQESMAGSAVSEESTAGRSGRAWTLRRKSKGLGDLTVEVEQPRDEENLAWFSFRAKGQLSERDLRLMAATLHSAMQTKRRGPTDAFERDFGQLFDMGPLGRMFEQVEPFLGSIQDMLEQFQRMQGVPIGPEENGEYGEGGGDWPGERDTLPTPLRRGPKHLDDLPGSSRAGGPAEGSEDWEQRRRQSKLDGVVKKLQSQGAQVFLPGKKEDIDWGILAGYEQQKRQIEDTVLLALTHPQVYDDIAHATRRHYASNRPRAVLFEGPPGTGKTTSARVMATQASVPLVYIPLEAIMSKWYGESERMLSDMLKACESFPNGCIIFLDELDALATTRGNDMHEATRRLLGVLLRHLDGFDANKRTVVIGATNRRQDLDPALLSRFSTTVNFGLPSEDCRAKILRQYAQHLSDAELLTLAHATPGMAGRDLKDVCEQAERRWASAIIRGRAQKGQLPPLQEYLDAAKQRLREMAGAGAGGGAVELEI